MAAHDDLELMQYVDGELGERHAAGVRARVEAKETQAKETQAKIEALGQVRDIVRSHLELAADDVPDHKFDAIWRSIDRATAAEEAPSTGLWSRITAWLDRHRGHVITGAVSAGAVAALALILRPGDRDPGARIEQGGAIDVQPASLRQAPEIEALDTPDGEGTVLNFRDEDGHTTVIWVSPADTVEGI